MKCAKQMIEPQQKLYCWFQITQLQFKVLTLCLDSVLSSASGSLVVLQRIWALVPVANSKTTGFFSLYFCSIISFKWELSPLLNFYCFFLIHLKSLLQSALKIRKSSYTIYMMRFDLSFKSCLYLSESNFWRYLALNCKQSFSVVLYIYKCLR